jgi:hypothetical protein
MTIKTRLERLERLNDANALLDRKHFTDGFLTESNAHIKVQVIGKNKKPLNGWHYVPKDKVLEINIA